jgi:hypothetical protein
LVFWFDPIRRVRAFNPMDEDCPAFASTEQFLNESTELDLSIIDLLLVVAVSLL